MPPAATGLAAILVATLLVYSPPVTLGFLGAASAAGLVAAGAGAIVPLEELPSLVAAISGSNPFPAGAVRLGLSALVGLALGVAALRGRAPRPDALSATALFGTLALGGVLLAHGAASTPESYSSEKASLVIIWNCLVLTAGVVIGADDRQLRLFAWVNLIIGVLISLYIVRGLATNSLEASVGGRFSLGAGDHPITLARFIAICILSALFLTRSKLSQTVRLSIAFALPPLVVALFAAGSRGPVLALAFGLVTFVALAPGTRATRRQLAVLVAVLLPVSTYLVATEVPAQNIERATAAFSTAPSRQQSNGRFEIWSEAASAFAAHPIVGVGSGGFSRIDDVAKYPHNFVLEAASEAGVLGLLAMGSILTAGLIAARRATRASRTLRISEDRLAFVAALVIMAVVNASFSGDLATNSALWLAIGLVLGVNLDLREAARRYVPRHAT